MLCEEIRRGVNHEDHAALAVHDKRMFGRVNVDDQHVFIRQTESFARE
jgi:hypothetical protein